jgi:predicted peptidase
VPDDSQSGSGSSFAPQTMPVPAPTPQARKEIPRNEKPLRDATSSYEKKEFVVPPEGGEKQGHTLTYYWKEPPKDASAPSPLVIVLHNAEGLAQAGESLIKKDNRHEFPAYIVVPELPIGKVWAFPEEFPDDPALTYMGAQKKAMPDVMALIDQLRQDNPIDPRRIYVIGCAEGGFGAYGAAKEHPDIFAAAVPINGGWAIKDSTELTRTPLFVLHGEKDAIFAPRLSRDVAYYVQMYGGNVSYVEVPGLGHDCGDPRLYTKTMWHWMFDQHLRSHKAAASAPPPAAPQQPSTSLMPAPIPSASDAPGWSPEQQ